MPMNERYRELLSPIEVKLSRIAEATDISSQTLRVLAVDHLIPLRKEGSSIYVKTEHMDALVEIAQKYIAKEEKAIGARRMPGSVKMIPPKTFKVSS